MSQNNSVVRATEWKLTIVDPEVVALANRFRWNPETLIKRVTESLASPIEQKAYMTLGVGFGIQPESFNTLLRKYLGDRELQDYDLETRGIATRLFPYILQALDLITEDRSGINARLSYDMAADLAILFGENATEVLRSIAENIESIADAMNWYETGADLLYRAVRHVIDVEHEGYCQRIEVLDYFQGVEHERNPYLSGDRE